MSVKLPAAGPQPSLPSSKLRAALNTAKIQSYTDQPNRGPQSTNIRSISWNCVGTHIATCSASNIRVWRPEQPNWRSAIDLKISIPGSRNPSSNKLLGTTSVKFSPRATNELASLGDDGTLRIWDIRGKGQPVATAATGEGGLGVLWHPAGNGIVVNRLDDEIIILDKRFLSPTESTLTPTLSVRQTQQTNGTAFSPSGRHLYLTTSSGHINIAEPSTAKTLHSIHAHTTVATCVQHSPASPVLATGGSDAMVTLWDTETYLPRHTLSEMSGVVRSLSFSNEGVYLVAGGDDVSESEGRKGIVVWHVDSGEAVGVIPTTGGVAASHVAFNPMNYMVGFAEGGLLRICLTGAA